MTDKNAPAKNLGDIDQPVAADPAFGDFLRTQLEPLLEKTESDRKAAQQEFKRRAVKAIVFVSVVAVVLVYLLWDVFAWIAFVLTVIVGVLFGAWTWFPLLGQSGRQKADIVGRMVRFYGDLEYNRHPNIDLTRYKRKGAPDFDSRFATDEIRGQFKGIPMRSAEVDLMKRRRVGTGSSARRETVTIFLGHYLEITLPERCNAITVFGSRGIFTGSFKPDESLGLLDLGNPEIEVYGTNADTAKAVLNADRLEALATLAQAFSGKRIMGSFYKDRLMVLIEHDGRYFDLPQQQETNMVHHAELVRTRLRPILLAVDRLSLQPGSQG